MCTSCGGALKICAGARMHAHARGVAQTERGAGGTRTDRLASRWAQRRPVCAAEVEQRVPRRLVLRRRRHHVVAVILEPVNVPATHATTPARHRQHADAMRRPPPRARRAARARAAAPGWGRRYQCSPSHSWGLLGTRTRSSAAAGRRVCATRVSSPSAATSAAAPASSSPRAGGALIVAETRTKGQGSTNQVRG